MKPRWTLRTAMAAVAVTALVILPLVILDRRRERFLDLAAWHASQARGFATDMTGFRVRFYDGEGRPVSDRDGFRDLWHSNLASTYRYAALQPWAPSPPNPEPNWRIFSDTPPPPPAPPSAADRAESRAVRASELREWESQPHYKRWLEDEGRRFP